MDKGSLCKIVVERLPCGGYVLRDEIEYQRLTTAHAAVTTIEEALAFVRHAVEDVGPEPGNS